LFSAFGGFPFFGLGWIRGSLAPKKPKKKEKKKKKKQKKQKKTKRRTAERQNGRTAEAKAHLFICLLVGG
jgi:flagellar biosynthesis component FlhA